ncbi:MAG TPA: Mrp/NBP35 family ATP-binding protein [Clostridiales bacterium]|nr:Mrp/NBP35 family ATP-binding protein [Clostridiales bacterium]
MSKSCNYNCESCSTDCNKRGKKDFSAKPHELTNIKKVIGIISGKGGVGKSLVTSLLAVSMRRKGYNIGILDGDITGPSIPKVFGINEKAYGSEIGLYPVESRTGISIMSVNLLLKEDTDPVIWRGPIIGNMVKQFWTDVVWGSLDYLFIDMPPGTGDVPLTVFQSIPLDGIVIVTSPQELVSMIVSKAVGMAEMMSIPIIGLVENMSYFHCPDNGKDYRIFGDSHIDDIAQQHNIETLAKLPIDPDLAAACDKGEIELYKGDWVQNISQVLEDMLLVEK